MSVEGRPEAVSGFGHDEVMTRSDDPRPALLVDVDGVLNVQPGPRRPQADWRGHRVLDAREVEYTVYVDPRFGEWLNGLADRFELAWCTTWGAAANERVAPLLGLPTDLPVVPLPGTWTDVPVSHSAKTPYVRAWAAGRAVAWLDGNIDERDALVLKRKDSPDGSRPCIAALPLNVDHDIGLTEGHIETLRAWLPGHEAQADLREENLQRMEATWGMLSAADVRSLTGRAGDPASHGLLAVERPRGTVYPGFQLVAGEDGASRVPPAWIELRELLAPAGWSDANVLVWSAAVNGWLEGRTPAEEIRDHPDGVTSALRYAVERAIPEVCKRGQ